MGTMNVDYSIYQKVYLKTANTHYKQTEDIKWYKGINVQSVNTLENGIIQVSMDTKFHKEWRITTWRNISPTSSQEQYFITDNALGVFLQ